MFARTKKSGKYEYLQVVENRREGPKVNQHVIATLGRLDQMHAKGEVETLVRSLARFSEKALLILSGRSDITAECTTIGPALIFERLWKDLGISKGPRRAPFRKVFLLRCGAGAFPDRPSQADGKRF